MTELGYIILASAAGLIIGSFINVCLYRIPNDLSIVTGNRGRSMCPICKQTLAWKDLIPIISYILLKGHCRYCGKRISLRYPIVESIYGIVWAFLAWYYGAGMKAVLISAYFSILFPLAYIDYRTMEISDVFPILILGLSLISLPISGFPDFGQRLLGVIIVSVPMLALAILFQGFGMGDVLLMAVSGFFLGWKVILLAFFIAIMTGGIHAIWLLAKSGAKTKIPFAPYLSVGLMIGAIWTDPIIEWYWKLFAY